MRSFSQHLARHSHFHWQPGDLHRVEGISEDLKDFSLTDLVKRKFSVRTDHPSMYPELAEIHPDEIHNQMTHRGTYDPRDAGNSSMEDHYKKLGRHEELMARRQEYYHGANRHYLDAINAHGEYKGDSSPYNRLLRDPSNHRKDHISLDIGPSRLGEFHSLDKITNHPTVKPMSLYRGFGSHFDIRSMEPGHEFVDHGYTGLSPRRGLALNASMPTWGHEKDPLHRTTPVGMVHIPAGTKGHLLDLTDYGGPNTPLHREKEFLLHRGTRFRVMGHARSEAKPGGSDSDWPSTPMHVVHLQVVGQHHLPIKRLYDSPTSYEPHEP